MDSVVPKLPEAPRPDLISPLTRRNNQGGQGHQDESLWELNQSPKSSVSMTASMITSISAAGSGLNAARTSLTEGGSVPTYAPFLKALGGRVLIEEFKLRSDQLQKEIQRRNPVEDGVKPSMEQDPIFNQLSVEEILQVVTTAARPRLEKVCHRFAEHAQKRQDIKVEVALDPVLALDKAEVVVRVKHGSSGAKATDFARATVSLPLSVGLEGLYAVAEELLDFPELDGGCTSLVSMEDKFQGADENPSYMALVLLVSVKGVVCQLDLTFSELAEVRLQRLGTDTSAADLDNCLVDAAIRNNLEDVKDALSKGGKPNRARDRFGFTCAHYAAQHGNTAMVTALLEKQAAPMMFDKESRLPLHRAAMLGHWDTAKALLAASKSFLAQHKRPLQAHFEKALKSESTTAFQSLAELVEVSLLECEEIGKEVLEFVLELLSFAGLSSKTLLLHWARTRCTAAWCAAFAKEDIASLLGELPDGILDIAVEGNARGVVQALLEKAPSLRLKSYVFEEDRPWIVEVHPEPASDPFLVTRTLVEGDPGQGQESSFRKAFRYAWSKDDTLIHAHIAAGVRMPVDERTISWSFRKSVLHLAAEKIGNYEQALVLQKLELLTPHATGDELLAAGGEKDESFLDMVLSSSDSALREAVLKSISPDALLVVWWWSVAAAGREQVLKELLGAKLLDIDTVEENGSSALVVASRNGLLEATKLLLAHQCQVNLRNNEGSSALLLASFFGHGDLTELLLSKRADAKTEDNHGGTALIAACKTQNQTMVSLLLKKKAAVDAQMQDGETALTCVCREGNDALVKLVLEGSANVNLAKKDGRTSLMVAAALGHLPVVELLLTRKAAVDQSKSDGRTALMLACLRGHLPVAEKLLQGGAELDVQTLEGETALMLACKEGHSNIVELLLEKSAKADLQNSLGETSLIVATELNELPIVELLLKHGADASLRREGGGTALWIAAENNFTSLVKQLLSNGAAVDAACDDGWTPLMRTSLNGDLETLQLLLKHHAQVNSQNRWGWTALMIASQNGHAAPVEELLKGRAHVDSQEKDGWSALLFASASVHFQVIRVLVQSGASVALCNNAGKNSKDLAATPEIAEFLGEHIY